MSYLLLVTHKNIVWAGHLLSPIFKQGITFYKFQYPIFTQIIKELPCILTYVFSRLVVQCTDHEDTEKNDHSSEVQVGSIMDKAITQNWQAIDIIICKKKHDRGNNHLLAAFTKPILESQSPELT